MIKQARDDEDSIFNLNIQIAGADPVEISLSDVPVLKKQGIEVTETADGKQVVNEITLPYLLLGRQAYDYFNPYDSNRLR